MCRASLLFLPGKPTHSSPTSSTLYTTFPRRHPTGTCGITLNICTFTINTMVGIVHVFSSVAVKTKILSAFCCLLHTCRSTAVQKFLCDSQKLESDLWALLSSVNGSGSEPTLMVFIPPGGLYQHRLSLQELEALRSWTQETPGGRNAAFKAYWPR